MKRKNTFISLLTLLICITVVHCFAFWVKEHSLRISKMHHDENFSIVVGGDHVIRGVGDNSENSQRIIYGALLNVGWGNLLYLILALAVVIIVVLFRYSIFEKNLYKWLFSIAISLSFLIF